MKNERATKEKMIECAKAEFMDKGYMKASLRNICKNAGVTTGALYFFFKDKEDLFASIVEKPLGKLYELMQQHYSEEIDHIEAEYSSKHDSHNDLEDARTILHFLYSYKDEFILILSMSQGSRFEKTIDQFVAVTEKHYTSMINEIVIHRPEVKVDKFVIHWISHMQIDMFVHILNHESSEDEAVEVIMPIVTYMIAGWNGMLGIH